MGQQKRTGAGRHWIGIHREGLWGGGRGQETAGLHCIKCTPLSGPGGIRRQGQSGTARGQPKCALRTLGNGGTSWGGGRGAADVKKCGRKKAAAALAWGAGVGGFSAGLLAGDGYCACVYGLWCGGVEKRVCRAPTHLLTAALLAVRLLRLPPRAQGLWLLLWLWLLLSLALKGGPQGRDHVVQSS